MPTRASDRVTLAVVASPTYVRTYYRVQASNLAAPAAPTTNPPASPWSTTEPAYTAGSTDTLYTVQLIAYGSAAFEYGPVQKSSAFEAAKQAYNLANQANQGQAAVPRPLHGTAVPTTNAPTAPNGSVYFRHQGTADGPIIASYTRASGAWVETPVRILAGQIIGGEVIGLTFKTAEAGARVETTTDRIIFYRGAPAGEPDLGQGIRAVDNGAAGTLLDVNGFLIGSQNLPVSGSVLASAPSAAIDRLHSDTIQTAGNGAPDFPFGASVKGAQVPVFHGATFNAPALGPGGIAYATITLPAGRYSGAPLCYYSPREPRYGVGITSITKDSVSFIIFNGTSGSGVASQVNVLTAA